MTKMIKAFAFCLLLLGCSEEKEYNTTVITANGEVHYNLETAITLEQQSKGLMNRSSLAENGGMIFVIEPVRHVTMWMKDTQIPLDIIFINQEAEIVKIIENAKPMSEEYLNSDEPVRAVIEVSAGTIQKHGIKVGDKVKNTALDNIPAPQEDNTPEAPETEESKS